MLLLRHIVIGADDPLARSLIEEHGTRAVLVAVERLNQSIDERDIHSRDFWFQVVHAIHEHRSLIQSSKQRVSRLCTSLPAGKLLASGILHKKGREG